MADALQLIRENKKKHARGEDATRLDIGNCGLTKLPDELFDCVWLEELILSYEWWEWDFGKKEWKKINSRNKGEENVLSTLDMRFAELSKLKKLIAGGRNTKKWGVISLEPLKNLKNLAMLDVRSSQITSLEPLKNLENLVTIDVSYNQIASLEPLKNLKNLAMLDVRSNQIASLEPLKNLENLITLFINDNQITSLEPLKSLENFATLEISYNQIASLEPLLDLILKKNIPVNWIWTSIGNGIFTTNNPWQHPPSEIIQQGREAILNYFKELRKGEEEQISEAKLLLIGDGRSGKTSLRYRLAHPTRELPTEADRTEGVEIEIDGYSWETARDRNFKLNLWDFAGQDKYQPLHTFFYTRRSLYVLVADSGKKDTDFDDWLQTVQLFGSTLDEKTGETRENSPLLIVLNEFSENTGGSNPVFNEEALRRRYPFIREVCRANLKTRKGVEAIEKFVKLYAQALPHTSEFIPKSWADIRRELVAQRDQNTMSFQSYLELCDRHGLDSETRALFLSQYLHDLGVLLHFQDNELLRQTLILKNEWATDAVYRILEDKVIAEKHGRFGRDDYERVWVESKYKFNRPQLLELMEKFKLAYPLPGEREWIAPLLLPVEPPEGYVWEESPDDLQIYVEYEFMPKGLLTRLAVTRHQNIAEQKELIWRDGVVLEWDNARAEAVFLSKFKGKDTIRIRTRGFAKRDFMTVINDELEKLHPPGVRAERMIPCICGRCQTKNEPYFYKKTDLDRRLLNNRAEVECELFYNKVYVKALLGNVFSSEKPADLDKKHGVATNKPAPVKLFISYSHKDEDLKKEFQTRLAKMKRDGKITFWQDRELLPGAEFDKEIAEKLEDADIVCLLVSPDFIASNYCFSIEMEKALEKYEAGKGQVVPIILRPTDDWTDCKLGKFNAVPTDGKPLTLHSNTDAAWADVTGKIRNLVEDILEKRK